MPSIKALAGMLAALAVVSLGVSTEVFSASPADTYPNRIVRMIVPYPPGGGGDVVGRLVARRLEKALGQPFVIDNRPGAAGSIGAGLVARSKPDGYTILATASGVVVGNPHIYRRRDYGSSRQRWSIAGTRGHHSCAHAVDA
ncbi:MAG: hypothetical protein IT529_00490 [Burkholderiales bacterium]|nr:hypothetical protein [Burkholderiales bacterium]